MYSSHLGSKYIPYLVWVVLQIPSTLAFQNAWVTFAGTPLFRGRYTAIHTKWRRLLRGLHYELIGLRARHSRVLRTAYPTAIVGLGLLTLSVVGQQNGGREIHELATVGVIGALSMLYLALALLFGGWLSRPKRLRADIEAFGHVCNVLSMGPYLLDARAYGMRRLTVVSLGNLAECLEQRLPRSLGMEDGAGDAEIRKRFSQMASRVREWQCHAALPTRGGHIEWLEHLAGVGAAIATQSLGEVVPWSSPVDEVVPRSGATATSIAGRVVGRALVGVTPGALYLVAKYGLRIELDTALEATWVPLSAGWAFTTLRSVFPDYKNRVGSTAQILGMLSPAKKGA
ncbi:hypothetical protein AU194_16245 [Mycobacterium sp. GA-2829]|nr:hypothetical protein AU194_16245 [Mycobacterium sp. GA-2829]